MNTNMVQNPKGQHPPLFDIPAPDRLITVKEAGELLALSKFTLYGMASEGKMPCVKIGRCVRFRLSDIRKLIS